MPKQVENLKKYSKKASNLSEIAKIQDGDCFYAKGAWSLKAKRSAGQSYLLFVVMADISAIGSQRVTLRQQKTILAHFNWE